MTKNYWIEYRDQMWRDLMGVLKVSDPERLPPVFLTPKRPTALKVGIHKDILERYPDADPEALSAWLALWTGSHWYLKRFEYGKNRHDIDGVDAGEISSTDKKHAAGVMRRRRNRRKKAA